MAWLRQQSKYTCLFVERIATGSECGRKNAREDLHQAGKKVPRAAAKQRVSELTLGHSDVRPAKRNDPLLLRFLVPLVLLVLALLFLWRLLVGRAQRTRRRLVPLRRLCPTARIRKIVRLRCGRTLTPHREFCRAIGRGRLHLRMIHLWTSIRRGLVPLRTIVRLRAIIVRTSLGSRLIHWSGSTRWSRTRAGTLIQGGLDDWVVP